MSIANAMSGMAEGKMPMRGAREPIEREKPEGEGENSDIHEHLKAMSEKHGGSHMHIHSDGMTHTTHHIHEGGEVKGPHEHHSAEALKEHVGKFAEGEDGEPGGGDGQDENNDSIFG